MLIGTFIGTLVWSLKRLYESIQDRIKVYGSCIKVYKTVQKCIKSLKPKSLFP